MILEFLGPHMYSPAGPWEPKTQKWSFSLSTCPPEMGRMGQARYPGHDSPSGPQILGLVAGGGKSQNNRTVPFSDPMHSITVTTTTNQCLQCVRTSSMHVIQRHLFKPFNSPESYHYGSTARISMQAGRQDSDSTASGIFCENYTQN